MISHRAGHLLSATATVFGLALASAAAAQDVPAAAAPEAGGLEDIVVTARRTNEALQSTPVAVTALSGSLLKQQQITQVTELARAAPSLSIATGGNGPASLVFLAIRGQAQNSPTSFSDAAVGIYIDGVYVARPLVGNLGFLDMASAEILRGPQGTLFGRNTTGGALNITTAPPEDKFTGYLKGGLGNYDQRVVEGVANLPATDTLAFRFSGRYYERDGYNKNPYFGKRQGNVSGEYYARGSAKWEPTELPITLNVTGDYMHYRDDGNSIGVVAYNPAGPIAAFYGLALAGTPGFENFNWGNGGPLEQYLNGAFATDAQKAQLLSKNWQTTYAAPRTGNPRIDKMHNFNEAGSVTANLAVDLGDVTVKSITGYRESTTENTGDLSGAPIGAGAYVSRYKQHQFSEELQLSGDIGHLQYIAGLYYFREAGTEGTDSAIFYNTPFESKSSDLGDFISESRGIFAQVNYNLTDALRITGGIRYTWDKRVIDRHSRVSWAIPDPICSVGASAGQPISAAPCTDRDSAKFDYPAWTAGIDYKISPALFIYAKTSGASMSGGFNARPVPAPYSSSYNPEKVRDVEAGIKGEFFDRRLRTNLAAFHAWQSDVQRLINTTVTDQSGTRVTQFISNAGKAHIYGFEFEGTVIPWEGMTINGSLAYLHANYVKGSRFENQLVGGAIVSVDRSGEPLTQAPKYTANIGASQNVPLSFGQIAIRADYAYISSRYFDYFTTGDPAQTAAVAFANRAARIRGYGLLSAQATLTLDNPKVEIAVWGKNLTDKAWFSNLFNSYTGLGVIQQYQGAPRTYGMTATFKW